MLILRVVKAEAVAKSINDISPNRAIAVAGDVMDAAYIDTLVKKSAEFGGGKIHIIVNNAGFTWDGVIHKVCPFPSLHKVLHGITTERVDRSVSNLDHR